VCCVFVWGGGGGGVRIHEIVRPWEGGRRIEVGYNS